MRLGLLRPTTQVSRPFGKPLEVYRCQTDGGLIALDEQDPLRLKLKLHGGHQVKTPVLVKPYELLMIWFRIL